MTVEYGGGNAVEPGGAFFVIDGEALFADSCELLFEPGWVSDGFGREAGEFAGDEAGDGRWCLEGEQRFAEAGGVEVAAFAGIGVEVEGTGAADGVEIEQPQAIDGAQMDEAAGLLGGFLEDEEGGLVDAGAAEVPGAGPERFSGKAVAAALFFLFEIAGFAEGGGEAVGGGGGQGEGGGDFGEGEFVGGRGEEVEDLKAAECRGHCLAAGRFGGVSHGMMVA